MESNKVSLSGATPGGTTHRSPSHPGAAVIGLMFALGLLALAVPRLVAAALTIDVPAVLWDAHTGVAVDGPRLKEAGQALARAEHWVDDGEATSDRGYLLLHEANVMPAGPERDAVLAQAEAATTAGLARAPSQPSAWWRLAHLRNLHGDRAGAARALRLSFLAGGFVPSIMKPRLEFALRLVPFMDAEMRSLLLRQIRLAWVVEPDYVAGLSARAEMAPLVKEALETMSEQEAAAYLHHRRRRP